MGWSKKRRNSCTTQNPLKFQNNTQICEIAFKRMEKLFDQMDDIGILTDTMRKYQRYQIVPVERAEPIERFRNRVIQTPPSPLQDPYIPTSRSTTPESTSPPWPALRTRPLTIKPDSVEADSLVRPPVQSSGKNPHLA